MNAGQQVRKAHKLSDIQPVRIIDGGEPLPVPPVQDRFILHHKNTGKEKGRKNEEEKKGIFIVLITLLVHSTGPGTGTVPVVDGALQLHKDIQQEGAPLQPTSFPRP
jgi:hypothetical protein